VRKVDFRGLETTRTSAEKRKKSPVKKLNSVRKTDFRTNNTSPATLSDLDTDPTTHNKRQLSPKLTPRSPPSILSKSQRKSTKSAEKNPNSLIPDTRNTMKVKILITK